LGGGSEPRITFFEYISVGIAFVLSFGVVRLLDGISHALVREKRYWPHVLWIAIKLHNHFTVWWMYWALRDLEWTYATFMAQLSIPVVLYLQASALVSSRPESIDDWRVHFASIRRRFFGLNIAYLAGLTLIVPFASGDWSMPPIALAVTVVAFAISVVGLLFESHRVQSVLVAVAVIFNTLSIATSLSQPL
jgi:hypothetical protein